MMLTALRPTEDPLRNPSSPSSLPAGPPTRQALARSEHDQTSSPRSRSPRCQTRAPAKINLTLEVLGRRPDGYHELRSLVIGVGLYDHLHATSDPNGGVCVQCSEASLSGPSNLADKAARVLLNRCSALGIRLDLHKRIPVAAGLGGGSSDAASALRLCNELWNLKLSPDELAVAGAQVGSDVSLFFYLPSAVMTGRGEIVRPMPLAWNGCAVLVFPGIPISTASVYAAWKPRGAVTTERQPTPSLAERIAACRTAAEIAAITVNQLEPAVFRVAPALRELFDVLVSLNMGQPRVSGSGSAMYLLFDDPHSAACAASAICTRIPQVEAVTAAAPVGEVPVDWIQ